MKAEDHARDAVAGKVRANLPQAVSDRPREWHPDRPTMLHTLEVLAYGKAISLWEILQPFAHGFGASGGAEEDKRNSASNWLPVLNKMQCTI
jgi:hypothetical protein